jgi:hypothetical protein
MGLSSNEIALVLAGCVVLIGAVWALYRRGIFGPAKVTENAHPEQQVAKR